MMLIAMFLGGLVFGLGLILSGMTNPAKVIGFLDLGGKWDPSLAFVMGGALLVGTIAFHFAQKRKLSLLGEAMHLPTSTQITKRLVIGSAMFGAGWGLAGFCPGPAIVSLGAGVDSATVFVAAMLAGMWIFEQLERLRLRRSMTVHSKA